MSAAMSIASACNELRELNPELGLRALSRSGMHIGRDTMGTMANTLILVIEIVQSVAGSIGIVLAVPLVAAVSAWLLTAGKVSA